jgi:hypothetical protein
VHWKRSVKRQWPNLMYYPGTCLEGLKKNCGKPVRIACLQRDSNAGPPKHTAEILTSWQQPPAPHSRTPSNTIRLQLTSLSSVLKLTRIKAHKSLPHTAQDRSTEEERGSRILENGMKLRDGMWYWKQTPLGSLVRSGKTHVWYQLIKFLNTDSHLAGTTDNEASRI